MFSFLRRKVTSTLVVKQHGRIIRTVEFYSDGSHKTKVVK